jgi:type I restriction enzyme S subunit
MWESVKLGMLVTADQRHIDPTQSPEHSFAYLALENIEAGTGRIVQFAQTLGKQIGSSKLAFERGDILYGRLRPYLQKVAIAPFNGISATDLIPLRLRTKALIDPEYLREFFLSPAHLRDVEQLMSGARMPRVRTEDLLAMQIPLPSLGEQRRLVRSVLGFRMQRDRVAGLLDATVDLVDTQRRAVLSAGHTGRLAPLSPDGSNHSGQAFLNEVLAGRRLAWEQSQRRVVEAREESVSIERATGYREPATIEDGDFPHIPANWCWASLSQLTSATDPLCYGVVQPGEDDPTGVPLVRVNDLRDGTILIEQLRHVPQEVDDLHERSRLKGGEVLISLVGTIGRVAIAPEILAGANIARALAKITPVQGIPAAWIANALSMPWIQEVLLSRTREVARKTLNLSSLERTAIPLAPRSEIDEVLRIENGAFAVLERLDARIKEIRTSMAALSNEVLNRLFAGESTLRDVSEELIAEARERFVVRAVLDKQLAQKEVQTVKSRAKDRVSNIRRDLYEVLKEHKELEPYALLTHAGYSLDEVETFYQHLAESVGRGEIHELRPTDAPVVLVAT